LPSSGSSARPASSSTAASGELDGAGFQAWFEWEEEAFRYGVDPEITRDELTALIESSTVDLSADEHRAAHSGVGDFARWGQLGGLKTLTLYGSAWFVLLAKRRWEKVTATQLEEAFAILRTGRS
jgi:hypothetical protein